jgi:hypothetical protein
MEEALDFAYHLHFVDDSNTHEEQMRFWRGVDILLGRFPAEGEREALAGESDNEHS